MPSYKLKADATRKLLDEYFRRHMNQHQLNLDTNESVAEQKLFTAVLLHNSLPRDKDFVAFMHDRIWAIHETLHTGLLDEILNANTPAALRDAFRGMLLAAPNAPDADSVLDTGRRSHVSTSILSEVLCKVYPDQYSIKNKRSKWGLYFLANIGTVEAIDDMPYADFIDLAWQLWALLEKEYSTHGFSYDEKRRLWYVDRFFHWIYGRPETKEIRRALGYKD